MKHAVVLLILIAVLSGCTSQRRHLNLSAEHFDEAREIARKAVEQEGIVGLSVAIAVDDTILFAEGFGFADLERSRPASADTIYDIASTGKQFTAAAILRLVDDGVIGLDDRIRDVVPETPAHFPNATIYELLHHTSGFVSGSFDELNPPPGLDQPRGGLAVLDDIGLHQGRIEFGASETFKYSNSGYLLLGVAVEVASGEPYPEFVRERLFAPAQLRSATVCERPSTPDMAESLHRDDEGVRRVPPIHMSVYGGQGSICSSVLDLIRWNAALERGTIISETSLREFRSPGRVRGCDGQGEMPYGTGQRLGVFNGHRKVGHTGTFDGGSAVLATYPNAGLTIAVLSNTSRGGAPHARTIEGRIAARLLGVVAPTEPPPVRPIPENVRTQVEGVYVDGDNQFETRVVDDKLHIFKDDQVLAQLVWAGGHAFFDPDNPSARDLFIMDGEVAGWWVYELDGMCMNVHRRKCP